MFSLGLRIQTHREIIGAENLLANEQCVPQIH